MIFVEWKGLKQVIYTNIYDLFKYIMVRHKHIHLLHAYVCAKLKVLFILIEMNQSKKNGNDPYAGSPTNTLLRLLLPLNDPV